MKGLLSLCRRCQEVSSIGTRDNSHHGSANATLASLPADCGPSPRVMTGVEGLVDSVGLTAEGWTSAVSETEISLTELRALPELRYWNFVDRLSPRGWMDHERVTLAAVRPSAKLTNKRAAKIRESVISRSSIGTLMPCTTILAKIIK